jgi:hypothetical protein
MTLENVLYSANGTARTDDGRLDIRVSPAAVSSILIVPEALERPDFACATSNRSWVDASGKTCESWFFFANCKGLRALKPRDGSV